MTSILSPECVLPRRIVPTQTLSSDACSLGSFAEIIPQSVCTRHGLYIGAKMVFFVRILLWTLVRLSIIVPCTCHLIQCRRDLLHGLSRKSLNLYSAHIMASSTVALVCIFSLLSFCVLTTSVELKELIALHSSLGEYGGDLRTDTVTIIGATLDLQEKTTSQVRVFYLSTNQA